MDEGIFGRARDKLWRELRSSNITDAVSEGILSWSVKILNFVPPECFSNNKKNAVITKKMPY